MNDLTAVMTIFDCSRVPNTPGMTLGSTVDAEREEYEKLSGSYGNPGLNYVAFRACQPQYQLPLESKFAETFFKFISKKAPKLNNSIQLRDLLEFRGPYGTTEITMAIGVKIPFTWTA